jgi:hypothetical protein
MGISGKTKEECTAALRAAYLDPNRAFDYLMSGIPSDGGQPGGGHEHDGGMDYGDEEPSEGGQDMGGNPFAALASNPNFALIRQRILQDPSFY